MISSEHLEYTLTNLLLLTEYCTSRHLGEPKLITTPKHFSTVDKSTFGTPCQIRLITGGYKSTDVAGIVLQTLSEHLFPGT